tara:strand:- start:2710 stop:3639 length:930 start_codon:yes stop_codon:yes gene_type:complete
MAKYFNQKEEVIQIELTPYGKTLYSQGIFRPAYYTFYDKEILYDGQFGGFAETQNATVPRIKDTPRLHSNLRFGSSKKSVSTINSLNQNEQFVQVKPWNAEFYRFLGTGSPWSDYAPAWQINIMTGSSVQFDTSFNNNTGIEYQMFGTIPKRSVSMDISYLSDEIPENPPGRQFIFYREQDDTLLLDIQELNTIFKVNGNYEVEVFRERHGNDDDAEKSYQQLSFLNLGEGGPTMRQIMNLFSATGVDIRQELPFLTGDYVESYLEILVDNEIEVLPATNPSTLYTGKLTNLEGDVCEGIQPVSDEGNT